MHRKVVTVLFCDVVGSTALGESVDPEALQGLLARYFERMKGIVESHGGSVEKFIGDAVMAVFGVPAVHEDDALRAVRAAAEMRAAFPALGVEGRIGVNTGEVVSGSEERLATGDAVNVAARLQQAAEPGEVLVGEATLELVRAAIEAESVEPLELKGKADPVAAYRLLSVLDAPERSHESRFVGRARELALIRKGWERAREDQRCELVTIVGDAGIGKSRLVGEALANTGARVVRGRCLPYGDGITFSPVVEVIRQLDALPSDAAAATAIRSLLGETDQLTSAEEIAWGFRKLLEEQAALVVVFDDIQWGEDTFLDLVEGVALLSAGAAILLVCMARPDLLDRRAQWPVSIRLEPLAADVVAELIGDLSAGLRERITVAAGGNPLFLTEMLAMAEEAAIVEVPPTLRALLAARLDQLDAQERRVLEGGAVEGEIFHRGAVQALAPEEPQVTPRLAGLVRRELIRPDRAQLPGEDGFRFRHVLIRDAAYDALPKGTRAELHTRFADWLQQRGADLVELDEILGYHLEKASAYEDELGRHDAALAGRAGGHLLAAGRRALLRDDAAATVSLLSRAAELVPADDDRRPDLLTDLATALAEQGALEEAKAMLADGAALARVNGNSGAEWRARVARLWWASGSEDLALDAVEREAQEAVRTLEALGDARFAGKAWRVLSDVYNGRMEGARWQHALERALEHARRAGDQHEQSVCLWFLSGAMFYGPAPVDEVLRRHEELSAEYAGVPLAEAALDRMLGLCRIQRGEFAEARGLAERARQIWRERGRSYMEATLAFFLGALELMAQDLEAAERELRSGFEGLVAMGEIGRSSTLALILARVLALQGRAAEAEELLLRTEHGPPDSPHLHIRDAVLARVRADRGEGEEAERLARCAVAIVERTDYLNEHGDALYDLAEVLQKVGKHEESHAAFAEAARLYQQKGNLVQAAWARARTGSDAVADRVAT